MTTATSVRTLLAATVVALAAACGGSSAAGYTASDLQTGEQVSVEELKGSPRCW